MQQQLLPEASKSVPQAFRRRGLPEERKVETSELCEVLFDRIHHAARPEHRGVIELFNRWMAIADGTFSRGREMALTGIFYGDEPAERVREMSVPRCPGFGTRLRMERYSGRLFEIMSHTRMLHLNRSGVDHFGIPIFDLELLRHERHEGALHDIRESVTAAIQGNRCDVSDARGAYYVFQGYRILRFMERLIEGKSDWGAFSRRFPEVPVPGPLDMGTDLAEPEKLEVRSFAKYLNAHCIIS